MFVLPCFELQLLSDAGALPSRAAAAERLAMLYEHAHKTTAVATLRVLLLAPISADGRGAEEALGGAMASPQRKRTGRSRRS